MKTILFVLDYYIPHRGGIENVFENIILRLQQKGYKIIILTSQFDKQLKKHEILNTKSDKLEKIEIYRGGKNRLHFMIDAIKLGKSILRNKKYNIDVIHASTYGGAIPASILGKIFNKKVILTVHEIFGNLWFKYKGIIGGLFYKAFEFIIFKFNFDKYHCVSNNTAKDLKKYYKIDQKKIKIIHNGVDNNFWNKKNVSTKEISYTRDKYKRDKKFVFLYFGHAGKSKGIDYLIDSLPAILEIKNIKILFNIIDSKRTNKLLRKLNNIKEKYDSEKNKLQLLNGVSKQELRKLVASCDCVIAPSISEGFGSVHTETVSMGKILITTNTSVIPEVVWGKVKLITPENSNAIYLATKEIVKGIYQQIPKKNFNWDNSVEKIEKLY